MQFNIRRALCRNILCRGNNKNEVTAVKQKNRQPIKGQKMKVNFKNTMELSEEAINEVVTSEEGLYLMNEQNYSKSMLLAKNVTDLMDEYNTYQTLAEYGVVT